MSKKNGTKVASKSEYNHDAESYSEAVGITVDQGQAILDRIRKIANNGSSKADVIKHFENDLTAKELAIFLTQQGPFSMTGLSSDLEHIPGAELKDIGESEKDVKELESKFGRFTDTERCKDNCKASMITEDLTKTFTAHELAVAVVHDTDDLGHSGGIPPELAALLSSIGEDTDDDDSESADAMAAAED